MFDFKESLKTSTIFLGGGSKMIQEESIWISFGQVEIRRKRQACDHFDPRCFTRMKLQNLFFLRRAYVPYWQHPFQNNIIYILSPLHLYGKTAMFNEKYISKWRMLPLVSLLYQLQKHLLHLLFLHPNLWGCERWPASVL